MTKLTKLKYLLYFFRYLAPQFWRAMDTTPPNKWTSVTFDLKKVAQLERRSDE